MVYDGGSAAFGTMVLANWLPNQFYETNHVESDGTNSCVGASCFAPAHVIIAALNATAIVAAIVIATRSQELYKEISRSHAKKRIAEEAMASPLHSLMNELDFPDRGVA